MIAAALIAASAVALAAITWLFADGLAASFAHRRAARRRRFASMPIPLVVRRRDEHGDALFTLELEAPDRRRLPAFLPGQALTLVIPAARILKRRYSLAAWAPRPRSYRLGIRREPDGVGSSWLYTHLKVGSSITALPPVGRFILNPAHRDLVLVGGGIGITPMMAMTDAVAAAPQGRRVWLHHAARFKHELIDRAHFEARAEQQPWLHYRSILARAPEDWHGARGRLDARCLMDGPPDPRAAHYYFCARESVMHALMGELIDAGVPTDHLHWESFGGAQNDDQNAYVVDFEGRSLEFAGQPSLLAACDDWGIALDAECRSGACGACRLRLLEGEVADCQSSHAMLPPGEILACCKVPRSALKLARTK